MPTIKENWFPSEIGSQWHDSELGESGKNFFNMSPKAHLISWNFIKIKNLCSLKDIVKTMKKQVTDGEGVSASHVSDPGLAPVDRKNLQSSIIRKRTTQMKKWTKDLSRYFTKENI